VKHPRAPHALGLTARNSPAAARQRERETSCPALRAVRLPTFPPRNAYDRDAREPWRRSRSRSNPQWTPPGAASARSPLTSARRRPPRAAASTPTPPPASTPMVRPLPCLLPADTRTRDRPCSRVAALEFGFDSMGLAKLENRRSKVASYNAFALLYLL
jgi:hypothetical protein